MVETESVILAELELLAPASEVPAPDWQQVTPAARPRRGRWVNRRRVRLALGVAAVTLVAVAAAGAAYLASRRDSPKPVANGELVIDSAPGGVAQLSSVGADGRLRTLWRCPRALFCGSPGGMSWSPDGKRLALVMVNPRPHVAVRRPRRLDIAHASAHTSVYGPDLPWERLRAPRRCRLVAGRPVDRDHVWLIEDRADPPDRVGENAWSRPGSSTCGRRRGRPMARRLVFSAGAGRPLGDLRDRRRTGVTAVASRAAGRRPGRRTRRLIAYRGATHGASCGGLRLVDADTGRDASPASAANPCHQFGPRQAEAPEWSPDGTEIAVGSTSGVYVINADGTDLRRINSNSPYSGQPAWRPAHGKQSVRYGDRAESCGEC